MGSNFGATPSEDPLGNINSSYYFNGIDSSIIWENYSELDLTYSDFSISLWIKP